MSERKPPRRKAKPWTEGPRSKGRLQEAIDAAVLKEITAALKQSKGNVVEAAQYLGISHPGLYKRLGALGLEASKFRK